jgi:hypothetical protein
VRAVVLSNQQERTSTLKVVIGSLAALCTLVVATAPAVAASPLRKADYLGKLRRATAATSKAEDTAVAALESKNTSAAQVRTRFFVMGRTEVMVGKSFVAIVPPRAAAKANRDFAHAEIVLGHQNKAIAKKLPATKAAIAKYLQSLKPPSGGKMLDLAVAELHAAGFKI